MKRVEQVNLDGSISLDYDTSLSTKALFNCISESFPNVFKDEDGMICGEFEGQGYAIRAKNITYLGHPHPLYKKRIQISNDLVTFYENALKKHRIPILLGVYTYGENTLFCDFNIEDFIDKKAHNSSAHVYTSDLADAAVEGYFYKEDYYGNKITVFNSTVINAVLREKLGFEIDENDDSYSKEEIVGLVAEPTASYNYNRELGRIESAVISFFSTTTKHWHGMNCYKEMINANYKNRYQPEWPGYYLEYTFEKYILQNDLTRIIRYAQDKSKDGIDLDLFFPRIKMYGDLKAHSSHSNAIQGNDWDTVHRLIENPFTETHIYYIACEHETEKDSEHGYEVTLFWNAVQGKEDPMSYAGKMKNSVVLTRGYIFDINDNNKQFLTKFRQGVNSNGKPRKPKIMIERDNFSRFAIIENSL